MKKSRRVTAAMAAAVLSVTLTCGSAVSASAADTQTYDYTGTLSGTLTADGEEVTSDGETISSTTADVNTALAQNSGTLTISNGTLTKSGDDTNGDNCNFYGINSVLLAVNEGTTAYITASTLSATSEGSNGIFATDSAVVYAEDVTISTTAGNSRGLDATYGGTIVADNVDITTQGDHCAALATDRGGGYISVTNSTLSTAGSGSPLIYSTGDIEVDNVTGTATGSQIAGMEGLNTILIYNSELTSTNDATSGSDPIKNGVILYQSMSGDADTSTGETARFEAVNSTLTTSISDGAMFYVTNTTADILLSATTLDFDSDSVDFLYIAGNDSNNWGSAGSNGGTVTCTLLDESVTGDITVDTISSLDLYLLDGSVWTGSATIETNSVNTDVSDAPITVNIESGSSWVVTADTTITNLNAASGAEIVDASGNTVNVVDSSGNTLISGDSDITVTVTGTYSTDVSTDSDNELTDSYIDRTGFDSYYGTSTTFGTNASSSDSDENPFTDVSSSQYFYDPVLWAYTENVVYGTSSTTFSPYRTCTRAQFMCFLYRLAGEPDVTATTTSFTDVDEDAYYYDAVLWAVENGIAAGTSSTTFEPSATITRAQAISFLYRYSGETASSSTTDFTDVSASAYYYDAVIWGEENGIIAGTTDTTFSPYTSCTRAQTVTFLYRYANTDARLDV